MYHIVILLLKISFDINSPGEVPLKNLSCTVVFLAFYLLFQAIEPSICEIPTFYYFNFGVSTGGGGRKYKRWCEKQLNYPKTTPTRVVVIKRLRKKSDFFVFTESSGSNNNTADQKKKQSIPIRWTRSLLIILIPSQMNTNATTELFEDARTGHRVHLESFLKNLEKDEDVNVRDEVGGGGHWW